MKKWIITLEKQGGARKAVFERTLKWWQRALLEMAGFQIEEYRQ